MKSFFNKNEQSKLIKNKQKLSLNWENFLKEVQQSTVMVKYSLLDIIYNHTVYKTLYQIFTLLLIFLYLINFWFIRQDERILYYIVSIMLIVFFTFDLYLFIVIEGHPLNKSFFYFSILNIAFMIYDLPCTQIYMIENLFNTKLEIVKLSGIGYATSYIYFYLYQINLNIGFIRLLYLQWFTVWSTANQKIQTYLKNREKMQKQEIAQQQIINTKYQSNIVSEEKKINKDNNIGIKKIATSPGITDFNLHLYNNFFSKANVVQQKSTKKHGQKIIHKTITGNLYYIIFLFIIFMVFFDQINRTMFNDILFKGNLVGFLYTQSNSQLQSNQIISNVIVDYLNLSQLQLQNISIYLSQPVQGFSNANLYNKQNLSQQTFDSQYYKGYEYIYFISSIANNNAIQYTIIVFNSVQMYNNEIIFNSVRLLILVILLIVHSFMMQRDAMKLFIDPLKQMYKIIKSIKQDPVEAINKEYQQEFIQEIFLWRHPFQKLIEKEKAQYETTLLQKYLQKSSRLLVQGFGQAGSQLIINNLVENKINPSKQGRKISCIFGFIDIQHFTEVTQILKKDILQFTNYIAEIVHDQIDLHRGGVNKNLGDCFFVVWRFPDELHEVNISYDENGKERSDNTLKVFQGKNNPVTYTAEMALMSFLNTQIEIKKSQTIEKLQNLPQLKSSLKNFEIQLHYGMHIGWGIEGAIGSEFKIDASYLSPNVNLSSWLNAVAKQYGVDLLVSGQIYDILPEAIQKQMRLIDIVYLKGSLLEMRIFTYDMDLSVVECKGTFKEELNRAVISQAINETIKQKIILDQRSFSKQYLENSQVQERELAGLIINSSQIRACREYLQQEFFQTWKEGMDYYLQGDWQNAKTWFEKTQFYFRNKTDIPSKTHLQYMEKFNFVAPSEWHGVKKLYSK